MSTDKEIIAESINSLMEEMIQNILNEAGDVNTADDLFELLNNNPGRYTFAYAYYTYPVAVNKFMKNEDGTRGEPNPMAGRIFKSALIPFRWDETYKESVLRKDPDYEFGARSGSYERDETHSVIEHGPRGDYIPIVPQEYEPVWAVLQDDGTYKPVQKKEVVQYLKPPNPYQGNKFIPLKMERLYRLSAGRMVWVNSEFEYTYFGPNAPVE